MAEGAVLLGDDAGEDADGLAAQSVGADARVLERLPGGLQEQSLLRVERQGLAGADAEELGVETVGVVEEPALAGVGLPAHVGVGVEQLLQIPAAVGGEGADGVHPLGDQPPQLVRRGGATRVAAPHADHGDGFVVVAWCHGDGRGVRGGDRYGLVVDQFVPEVGDQQLGRRVVEQHRGRQVQPHGLAQHHEEFDAGERVDCRVQRHQKARLHFINRLGGSLRRGKNARAGCEHQRDCARNELRAHHFAS